jgi:hypothetical protein
MSALRWMWERRDLRTILRTYRRSCTRVLVQRKAIPAVESLETLALLSAGGLRLLHAEALLGHDRAETLHRSGYILPPSDPTATSYANNPVTSPVQTVTLASTLTNFTNTSLTPDLDLFNPALGTLVAATVSYSATVQSNITSQNLSGTSSTIITAVLNGSFQLNGLNQLISQPTEMLTSQPAPAGVHGSGTDTVTFPPLVLTDSATTTYTDPTSLAFFTSTNTQSTTAVTMTAMANASASAPNGNLYTVAVTTGLATVSVVYTYVPPSTPCPTVSGLGRIGVHHQRTLLVVNFSGTVDAAKASNPADYAVILSGGKKVPIKTATFNPTTNSVTLLSSKRLNVHHDYRLSLVIPCANEQTPETVVIPFGSKYSLVGFHNHRGEFVTVANGRITGFYKHNGAYIPVHAGKVENTKR